MRLDWDLDELLAFGSRIGNTAEFEEVCKRITRLIAKELHVMLQFQTPVKTGKLNGGWLNNHNFSYQIVAVPNGYEVTLINDVPYALYVNDGHYAYNQYGGPYVVKNRTPKIHDVTGSNKDATYVFGHFFVEKSILLLENSQVIQTIIYNELRKWFEWCVNG